jgi:phage repressor protein C with HTH and peptisase S24 domain
MEPVLPDGAVVGVDTSKTGIKDGQMYAIDQDGLLRVKLLYRLPNGIRVRSFNRDEYADEDYFYHEANKINIIGQVFWYSVLL